MSRMYASSDSVQGPLRRAPEWVRAIDPRAVDEQRRQGFPDFYGDDFCEECGQRNPTWWVAPEVWDVVTDGERGAALCPSCFCFAWQAKTGQEVVCELRVRPRDPRMTAAPTTDRKAAESP